ncbi:HAD-IA family hydrolase [Patescibacteria group bacterium]
MPKYKIVIYDFDGTIANTMPIVIDIVNNHAQEFGIDGVSQDEISELRGRPLKYLLEEFGIHVMQLPKLAGIVRTELSQRLSEVEMFEGINEVFLEIDKLGIEQGVVTSNYVKNVTDLFTDEQEKLFKFIRSEKAIFGKHHKIEKVIEEFGYIKEEVLYVGDEVRDIEACKKVEIDIAAVTWGFNSSEILKEHMPKYLVDIPSQLLDIVSS